jgi:hypothetical protein
MAPANSKKRRCVKWHLGHFEIGSSIYSNVGESPEFQRLLDNPVLSFPATDMLVLVPAAHMGDAPCCKRIESHGCCVMVTGKKIPGLV